MEKGHTNNPNGRPKGTPNKVTSEIKTWLAELLEESHDQIKSDLKAVDPEARLRLLFSLLPYIIPKQQTISEKTQVELASKEWKENSERIQREEAQRALDVLMGLDTPSE